MRGVHKVPGGKLVSIEFQLDQTNCLVEPRLAGDFFAEPPDAITRLEQALDGVSADLTADQLTARLVGSLLPSDQLIGFDAAAVALTVRRALGKATTWEDHSFELIEDGPQSPAMQMALDEVYARALGAGQRGPTLRIWQWASSAVVIGSFQSLRNEVDLEAAARHGVTVVRRISGGGAMFIEPGNTITYSLVVPGSLVDGLSFVESYAFLDNWVLRALGELGIQATYQPINDIASPSGKIAGAAQRRLADGTVLHHVTMAYDIDAAKMTEVLRIGRAKLSDKGTVSAAKRVDPLRSQTGLPREQIVTAFVDSFARQHRLVRSSPTAAELAEAQHLADTKFSSNEWTARVP
ncbi:MAG: lipoate--protein ligase family protein [Bifidobacteriaceae bacterium]|nr:lipoate--protein ligase family protein [Bifidobacteriaceae bacterium]